MSIHASDLKIAEAKKVVISSSDVLSNLTKSMVDLDTFLSKIVKIEKTAKDIFRAADFSGFDHVEIEKALHAHQADLKGPYDEFVKFKTKFELAAKAADVSLRKSAVPGGAARAPSDLSPMSADDLKVDAIRIMNAIPGAIKSAERKGKEMTEAISAFIATGGSDDAEPWLEKVDDWFAKLVVTKYFPLRDQINMIFGLIGGLIKRVNWRADLVGAVPISGMKVEDQRSVLMQRTAKFMGQEQVTEDFEIVVGGSKVAGAKTYREAVQLREKRFPLGEVKASSKKNPRKWLPWANDPDIVDL